MENKINGRPTKADGHEKAAFLDTEQSINRPRPSLPRGICSPTTTLDPSQLKRVPLFNEYVRIGPLFYLPSTVKVLLQVVLESNTLNKALQG